VPSPERMPRGFGHFRQHTYIGNSAKKRSASFQQSRQRALRAITVNSPSPKA
jgi:hypothetical protein